MARKWTDEWVKELEHPRPGEPERVFYDPTLNQHRLVVKRTKKVFEVQADQPRRFWQNGKRKTFVVQTGDTIDTTIECSRERAAVSLGRIRKGEDPRGRPAERETTLAGAWGEFKKRSALKKSTLRAYESSYDRCLEKWASTTLRTLVNNPRMARDEHAAIIKSRGPAEADHSLRLLRAIYRHAAKLDTTLPGDRNPCSAVDWCGDKKREGAAIPAATMPLWRREIQALREDSPIRAGFHVLCLRLGTRPGELARAKWADVDWKRRVLVVPESKTFLYEVPLTKQCIAELKKLEDARALNKNGSDFVFPSRVGRRALGHIARFTEPKGTLCFSGNSGRHTHHTLGTRLGVKEIVLDVLEGRSLQKAGAAGRGYIDRIELGPELRGAQESINREIDRLPSAKVRQNTSSQ
jgi:integrase